MEPEIARPASQPIHGVRVLRDVRIPVSDGLELSANLWLPVASSIAAEERFPALLEMIPYRKDDWRAAGDQARGEWFAARGYAFCRLDVRGTGSSPGIAEGEYTERQTQDGYGAVEWLAAQDWSNGKVGMWGISWGGFTAIQVAMLRPPHLAAIVPMYATDDRYTHDVHYVGGCVTASELSQYAVSMVGMNALPAKAAFRGEPWLAEWRERLENTPVWLFEWLRQQQDGPFWRVGSLAPDYDAIEAPMLLFGGWMDSYVDPVLRMIERCAAPRRAIIGNWVHSFPDDAYPGPNIDWLHETVRFLDHWLKGEPNGAMEEPRLILFRHEFAAPEAFPTSWPGVWLAEPDFPLPDTTDQVLWLAAGELPLVGRLSDTPPPTGTESLRYRPTAGTGGPLSWGAGGAPNGLARDLLPEDALVPTFTSEALAEPLDVVGFPVAWVAWESSVEVATAVVRLSDVAPDGTAAQVTAGILNLTHRGSHREPEPLPPGEVVEVRVPLRSTAHRFLPGHRVRFSVAAAAWPIVWPSPEAAVHRLHLGGDQRSRLVLPVVPARDGDAGSLPLPPFKTTPPGVPKLGESRDDPPAWQITEDVIAGSVTVSTSEFGETVTPDGATSLYSGERLAMTASARDPAHAEMRNEVVYRLRDDGREILVEAGGMTSSTATDFVMTVELRVHLDGELFFERHWEESIARRLV
jgi:putative CocE/NonD family hydrolase